MPELYYEDIEIDRTIEVGSRSLTAEEIVTFAEQYDPLPFHTDPDAAADTIHGGLIASGWHTVCVAHRAIVDGYRKDRAVVAGLSVDDVTFPESVRPGDTLSIQVEPFEKRPSESRPGYGLISQQVTVQNQDNQLVLSYAETMLVERRAPPG
jgi:acyl dehydratase